MGCPDWPKCFGMWIPPTHVSQLPVNYKQIFKVQGKEIADFDAFKTWVEYVNRLLGVVVGVQMFLMLLSSSSYWNIDKTYFSLSLLTLLLTGLQGWVGSVVVAKNLAEGVVTLHMLIAILIVFLLVFISFKLHAPKLEVIEISNCKLGKLFWLIFILTLVQIGLGTQVREAIDSISKLYQEQQREQWIEKVGIRFYVHRSFSLIVLALHLYLLYYFKVVAKQVASTWVLKIFSLLTIIVLAEIVSGAILAYFSVPTFIQPIHLILAILISSIQFVWVLWYYRSATYAKKLREA